MKKFSIIFILSIFVYFFSHFVIWEKRTSYFFDKEKSTKIGDLARLSYKLNLSKNRYNEEHKKKPKFHKVFNGQKNLDILTIGDSFSSGAGPDSHYYQDFIANKYNLNIANLNIVNDVSSTFEVTIQKEFLKKYNPRVIIIQTVQREFLNRFEKRYDEFEYSEKYIDDFLFRHKAKKINYQEKTGFDFITNLNFKPFLYDILYFFSENAFFSKVYIVDIKKNLFDHIYGNKLLFYYKDLEGHEDNSCKRVKSVVKNLNKYAENLKKFDTKLMLLIAPDKFHVYKQYLHKKKKENKLFDCIRSSKIKFEFINSDILLKNAVKNGVKEVYQFDDTHWTSKAIKILFDKSIFFKNLNKKNENIN